MQEMQNPSIRDHFGRDRDPSRTRSILYVTGTRVTYRVAKTGLFICPLFDVSILSCMSAPNFLKCDVRGIMKLKGRYGNCELLKVSVEKHVVRSVIDLVIRIY